MSQRILEAVDIEAGFVCGFNFSTLFTQPTLICAAQRLPEAHLRRTLWNLISDATYFKLENKEWSIGMSCLISSEFQWGLWDVLNAFWDGDVSDLLIISVHLSAFYTCYDVRIVSSIWWNNEVMVPSQRNTKEQNVLAYKTRDLSWRNVFGWPIWCGNSRGCIPPGFVFPKSVRHHGETEDKLVLRGKFLFHLHRCSVNTSFLEWVPTRRESASFYLLQIQQDTGASASFVMSQRGLCRLSVVESENRRGYVQNWVFGWRS